MNHSGQLCKGKCILCVNKFRVACANKCIYINDMKIDNRYGLSQGYCLTKEHCELVPKHINKIQTYHLVEYNFQLLQFGFLCVARFFLKTEEIKIRVMYLKINLFAISLGN